MLLKNTKYVVVHSGAEIISTAEDDSLLWFKAITNLFIHSDVKLMEIIYISYESMTLKDL